MNKVRITGLILLVIGLIGELTIDEGIIGIFSAILMGLGFPSTSDRSIQKTFFRVLEFQKNSD